MTRPIDANDWHESEDYLNGIALFNAGYYWEAHEAWERLWHAHERRGAIADLMRALIKLAAAGVKAREGRPAGVATHASRAAVLLDSIASEVGTRLLGLDLEWLGREATRLAEAPPDGSGVRDEAVARVLEIVLEPD